MIRVAYRPNDKNLAAKGARTIKNAAIPLSIHEIAIVVAEPCFVIKNFEKSTENVPKLIREMDIVTSDAEKPDCKRNNDNILVDMQTDEIPLNEEKKSSFFLSFAF